MRQTLRHRVRLARRDRVLELLRRVDEKEGPLDFIVAAAIVAVVAIVAACTWWGQ